MNNCFFLFKDFFWKINIGDDVFLVSCIVLDVVMSFIFDVVEELGVLDVVFWIVSVCGLMVFL